jgi:Mlc titration factor MtfA (ptsG expression regulator)
MIVLLALMGIGAFVLYRYNSDLKKGYGEAVRSAAPLRVKVLPVPKVFREILVKYFPYYRRLDDEKKERFAQRVAYFVYRKKFIPRNVDHVTIEAKVLIAATAIQLTFGLNDVYLDHFNKILVYPNDYYSSITKRFHKGEVNPRFGIIVISWQSFVDGFVYSADATNLGLHEMAHALRLDNVLRRRDYQFFDEALMKQFDAHAIQVCSVINWSDTFFRPYACANEHEFFSVACENFFERPMEFKQAMPELYTILAKLLNQDPSLLPAET